ncbi:hypothetical protein [Roseivivax isoporae]|uniref:Uncharacterized protein n=1 Tax=Roseivivax isoporae LMG 25204 TaxID=1449351 RepID=X7F836_9RHOB|nr:hypothetical protein [Roseivivax isoporae]ETX29047.1 hypothetical protein RISW2_03640 [Roseivivax isoporae LMG 25204]
MLTRLVPGLIVLGAGYLLARRYSRRAAAHRVAFRRYEDGGPPGQPAPVRDAGAAAQRDSPADWDAQDEAVDETFPASDPVTRY